MEKKNTALFFFFFFFVGVFFCLFAVLFFVDVEFSSTLRLSADALGANKFFLLNHQTCAQLFSCARTLLSMIFGQWITRKKQPPVALGKKNCWHTKAPLRPPPPARSACVNTCLLRTLHTQAHTSQKKKINSTHRCFVLHGCALLHCAQHNCVALLVRSGSLQQRAALVILEFLPHLGGTCNKRHGNSTTSITNWDCAERMEREREKKIQKKSKQKKWMNGDFTTDFSNN